MYWITGLLGLFFAVSPFLFNFSDNPIALWTSVILGAAVLVVSYVEGAADDKQRWEYVFAVLAGISAVAAPFIFGFGSVVEALWISVAFGVVLTLFAGGKLYFGDKSFQ